MLWVCRAGQEAAYYDEYINTSLIAIPWQGYNYDLSRFDTLSLFREVVINEKGLDNRTSVSNWASQLFAFCKQMKQGDYVLIPSFHSKTYALSEIASDYRYQDVSSDLHHVRYVTVLYKDIPREVFSQGVQYSLGAYRTIFKPNHADEIIATIHDWINNTLSKGAENG
ncbi:MAG: hypothetical protein GX800_08655 [Clostridiaceae bacterium]|jgi:restriction system protein|nr:hypothetical protein [Clostridiaceae bacterium]